MRRPRLPRPSPRRLSGALAVLGLVAGLAFVLLPVQAAVDDDPLLRLAPFSPALTQGASAVDCGAPVSNFGRRSEGLSLHQLAVDHVCRAAASRRAATAVAATFAIGVLGMITLTGSRTGRSAAA